jgi:hypothetical protein
LGATKRTGRRADVGGPTQRHHLQWSLYDRPLPQRAQRNAAKRGPALWKPERRDDKADNDDDDAWSGLAGQHGRVGGGWIPCLPVLVGLQVLVNQAGQLFEAHIEPEHEYLQLFQGRFGQPFGPKRSLSVSCRRETRRVREKNEEQRRRTKNETVNAFSPLAIPRGRASGGAQMRACSSSGRRGTNVYSLLRCAPTH